MTPSDDLGAYDRLSGYVIVVDGAGGILAWNQACVRLSGPGGEQVRGRRVWELVAAPGEAEGVREALERAASEERVCFESCWAAGGAPARSIAWSVNLDGQGRRLLTGVDVTEGVAAREEQRQRLHALMEQAPDGIFVADLEGRYTDVNEAGCRLLGYPREEIIGKTIVDLIPSEDVERLWQARERMLGGRVDVAEWRLRRKDGALVPVEVSAKILPDGRWQGLVRDLSARKQLERAVRQSYAELSRAQSAARIGSWRLDVGSGALRWSDEAHRIFGTVPGTLMTYEEFLKRVHPEDRVYVEQTWAEALAGAPYDLEHRILVGDEVRWVREKAELEIGPDGAPRGGLGVVQDITEQKRVALDQALWEQRLNAIVSIAPDAIVSFDEARRILLFNGGAERIYGWSRDEVLGRPLDVLMPEGMREVLRARVQAFMDGEAASARTSAGELEVWGLRKSGEAFPAEAAISKVEVGGQRLFTVWVRDVTEQRRAEQALRTSEERFRVSMQAAPVVVWNQDEDLRYTWVHNPAAPFEVEQVLGKTDRELLPAEDAEPLEALKRQVMVSGEGTRTILRTTVGGRIRHYDMTIEPLRDAEGRVRGIIAASWDVTDQRRREDEQRALAEAGAALMTATQSVDGLLAELGRVCVQGLADWFVIDLTGPLEFRRLKVQHADPGDAALAAALERGSLDRSRPHLMYASLRRGEARLVEEVTPAHLETIAQGEAHLRLLRQLELRSYITVPLVARGRLLGAFALMTSRRSRRYDARDLVLAQQLARVTALAVDSAQLYELAQRAIAARDDVLGMVAHDLRSPLSAVLMQADFMIRVGADCGDAAEIIRRSAQRMNRLVEDMLDVARLEAGKLSVNPATVASRVLLDDVVRAHEPAASAAGLALRLEVPEHLPDLRVDRDRLLQVFDNVVGNAIKFTPAGGEVVLSAEPRDGQVLFRVRDTGAGIAPDHLEHLFDRFWQARSDRRGAGLGLAIAKGLVEAHGGQIWADSEPGRGTTVCFALPKA